MNGLGDQCIYACLAPCCIPRVVMSQKRQETTTTPFRIDQTKEYTLTVQLLESIEERQIRLDYMQRRQRTRRKPREGPCFFCQDETHGLLDCTLLPKLPIMQQMKIHREFHSATVPCWNCFQFGHYKEDCPVVVSKKLTAMHPPQMKVDVTQILQAERPFQTYCTLLAECFQNRCYEVIQTDLEKSESHHQEHPSPQQDQQESNWNSERKSIFIVAQQLQPEQQ